MWLKRLSVGPICISYNIHFFNVASLFYYSVCYVAAFILYLLNFTYARFMLYNGFLTRGSVELANLCHRSVNLSSIYTFICAGQMQL